MAWPGSGSGAGPARPAARPACCAPRRPARRTPATGAARAGGHSTAGRRWAWRWRVGGVVKIIAERRADRDALDSGVSMARLAPAARVRDRQRSWRRGGLRLAGAPAGIVLASVTMEEGSDGIEEHDLAHGTGRATGAAVAGGFAGAAGLAA